MGHRVQGQNARSIDLAQLAASDEVADPVHKLDHGVRGMCGGHQCPEVDREYDGGTPLVLNDAWGVVRLLVWQGRNVWMA